MPKKKAHIKTAHPSIVREFTKFWRKLDNQQQIMVLASVIVLIALMFGVSLATKSELILLRTEAATLKKLNDMPDRPVQPAQTAPGNYRY